MNELQTIIEAMSGLGEDAKMAFIVLVIAKYGASAFSTLITGGGFIAFAVLVTSTIRYGIREFWKHS